ncbi:hypothetical protein [Pelotomaculum sp. PtaB.Bin117]|uniref:hypothetical protein n=1 Tax=Pelotomaculum sp. PtaB.Bin117 TaxID=1811694 RepID=UPI0009D39E23|nr:hypothetical protein [Pelotomaculum sp. PtaB.Bin117]OPX89613.1 MAG: hypothetical protein A4E54_00912 [Pelotomaculum sp. PtaB.Bin117]OPY61050.1 MAG: hypothetical protein A4E56_02294 [Pelotomaculum sp. PtaU1.Bin065]
MSVSLNSIEGSGPVLLSLAGALFAAGLAWQLNRCRAYLPGLNMVYYTPLVEEFAKTVPAVLIGASLFFTHVFFGVVETVWELFSRRRNGLYAGLAALAGHSIYGFITAMAYERYGAVAPALFAGYLAHAAWNFTVASLVNYH